MIQQYLTRQLDIIPESVLSTPISIVGAGAVGSFTALSLCKMGFYNIKVYDFDTVSPENMNCQFYKISDIDRPKVEALKDLVKEFTGTEITVENIEIRPYHKLESDILIAAADSMKVRKMLFKNTPCKWFIDSRMGSEYAKVEVVDMHKDDHKKEYEKTLYSDNEAVQERCTAKATIYTVNLISGLICKAVKDIVTNNEYVQSIDWNIEKNASLAFNNKGRRL